MAGPLRCQYVLGPCDTRVVMLPVDQLQGGSVACGGGVYYVRPATANPVFLDYAPHVERAQIANVAYDPHAVLLSFSALLKTLAFTVPRELRQASAAIARIRKAVR